ncbi:hypothetical protein BpHYR1_045962 [Brachionus plicatilis]|uniref:Uncharacterized protein n=1 Tax=Brachionus plicatilis TaxID=10195 RepID=A0A3M7T6Z7_BRAPC|nr:hypothetical protein BpHYR1_045962 [Brachionus plicatilis]
MLILNLKIIIQPILNFDFFSERSFAVPCMLDTITFEIKTLQKINFKKFQFKNRFYQWIYLHNILILKSKKKTYCIEMIF